MLAIYRKFFRFAGRHARDWYVSIALEFFQAIAIAVEIVPLFVVLRDMLAGTLSAQTAQAAFGIMAAAVAAQAVLHYASHKREMRAAYLMLDDKRISIGERLKHVPMGFFNERSLGNLTAICTSTMEDMESMAGAIVVRILTGIMHAAVLSVGFAFVDWRVGAVLLAGIACMLWVNSRMLAMSQRHSPARLAAQMRLVDGVLEYLQGLAVVKSFNLMGNATTSLERTIRETERQNFFLEKKSIPYTVAQQCVLRLFAVAAVALSVWLHLAGEMELFECLLMIVGGFFVYSQIEQSGSLAFMLPMVDASIDRVEEVDSTPLMEERGSVERAADAGIVLDGVSFSYGEGKGARTVVDDVSLSIPAGTTCAIVGPSGSGKTTLVNLMARFWGRGRGRGAPWRRRRPRLEARRAHGQFLDGVSERVPVQRHGGEQHPLRPARGHARGGDGRGPRGALLRLRTRPAAGLRHGDRGGRGHRVRGREAAHLHRAGAFERRARWCSSTRPRPTSIPRTRPTWWPPSKRCARARPW